MAEQQSDNTPNHPDSENEPTQSAKPWLSHPVVQTLLHPRLWPLNLAITLIALWQIWLARFPEPIWHNSPKSYALIKWTSYTAIAWWLIHVLALIAVLALRPRIPTRNLIRRWPAWLVLPLITFSAHKFISTDGPFRLSFYLSRPSMEKLSRDLQTQPTTPDRHIGLFTAQHIVNFGRQTAFSILSRPTDDWVVIHDPTNVAAPFVYPGSIVRNMGNGWAICHAGPNWEHHYRLKEFALSLHDNSTFARDYLDLLPEDGAIIEAVNWKSISYLTRPTLRPDLAALIAAKADATALLIPLTSHTDPHVRLRACCALAMIGPPAADAFPALLTCLQDSDECVREAASTAIVRMASDDTPATTELLAATDDTNPWVRSNAVAALIAINAPAADVMPKLTLLLNEVLTPAPAVTRFIRSPLRNELDPSPFYRPRREDLSLASRTLKLLEKYGPNALPTAEAVGQLLDVPLYSASAAKTVAAMGPKAAPPALKAMSRDMSPQHDQAVEIITAIADPGVMAVLVQKLSDSSSPARTGARDILRRIGAPALPELQKALADPGLRIQAALLFAEIAPERTSDFVPILLDSLPADVDGQIVKILIHLGNRAIPFLVAALDSPDANTRRQAANMLEEINISNPAALAKLRELQSDKNPNARNAARHAYNALNHGPSPPASEAH